METKERIYLIFRFFMVLVYLSLGVMILFFDTLPFAISNAGKALIGIVFLLYGVFRIYIIYKSFMANDDED